MGPPRALPDSFVTGMVQPAWSSAPTAAEQGIRAGKPWLDGALQLSSGVGRTLEKGHDQRAQSGAPLRSQLRPPRDSRDRLCLLARMDSLWCPRRHTALLDPQRRAASRLSSRTRLVRSGAKKSGRLLSALSGVGIVAFLLHGTFLLLGHPEFRLPTSLALFGLILLVSVAQGWYTLMLLRETRSS